MTRYIVLYFSTIAVMLPLDLLFIGLFARNHFQSQLGSAVGDISAVAGILFYLLYAAGIVIFVNGAAGVEWKQALQYGALFGLMCYGTYELTSMAIMKDWSWKLVVPDMVWGSFVTAVAGTAGLLITKKILG